MLRKSKNHSSLSSDLLGIQCLQPAEVQDSPAESHPEVKLLPPTSWKAAQGIPAFWALQFEKKCKR